MNNNKIIAIVSILVVSIIIAGLYGTYAASSIVTGTDNTYAVTLTGGSNSVVVPADSSKNIIYQITNTNKGTVQYGIAYKGDDTNVEVYNTNEETATGIIGYGENKYVKLLITNMSNVDKTIEIKAILGYEHGGEIILPSGYNWVSEEYYDFTVSKTLPLKIYSSGEDLINYKIYGNSVQNGTPTSETPIEIESVGDKTHNIVDLSKTVVSTGTPHVTFNYDNSTGTIELTSTPTQYDYLMIYLSNLDYQFEVGKKYYWGAQITVSDKTTTDRTTVLFGVSYENFDSSSLAYVISNDQTFNATGSFTYNNQNNLRLFMYPNWGSLDPGNVKFEKIYLSEENEFEPYGKYKIPIKISNTNEEITTKIYVDEPLKKVNDYADYIDFENKKFIKNVEVIDNTGTLTLEESLQGLATPIESSIEFPNIPTLKGLITIETITKVEPSSVLVTYKGKKS